MSFLYVQIYHGPAYTFNNNIHKPQFLAGLREKLQNIGYRVDLVPTDFANYCMIEMCGHEIFRCNIQQLHFNTISARDVVCQRAVDAVMQASLKFRRARAYLWFWTLIEHEMFIRGEHTPVDHWLDAIPFKDAVTTTICDTCEECCALNSRHLNKSLE